MAQFRDLATIKGDARITPQGYLVADALVGRANNVQEYRASELGLTDRAPNDIVRIFRPEAEIFDERSLATVARLPITLDHPAVDVNASNWREFARGETDGQVVRDGEFIRVPLRVTDAPAVASVQTDRQEFSLGYSADIRLEAGVHDGQAYDASLANVRYNHLAACRTARGGPELRIIDERPPTREPENKPMSKIIMVDGLPVDVANADTAAQVVGNAIAARDTAQSALEGALANVATRDADIAARDATIAGLRDEVKAATLTPEQLRDAVAAYTRTRAVADSLSVTVGDADDAATIRRAVVAKALGDTAAQYTPEQVDAAFAVIAAKAGDAAPAADPLREALRDGKPVATGDGRQTMLDAKANRLARLRGETSKGA